MIRHRARKSSGQSGLRAAGHSASLRWLHLAAGLLTTLSACKDKSGVATNTGEDKGSHSSAEKPPERETRKFNPPGTDSRSAVPLLLDRINGSRGEKLDLSIRASIAKIANDTGNSISEVLAELLRSPHISDGAVVELRDAFLDSPEDFATGAWEGLDGKRRSGAIRAYANVHFTNANEGGLRNFYNALPPSDDRVHVAGTFAKLVAARDFNQGIREIEGFDFPEERRRSFTQLAIQLRQSPEAGYADRLKALLETAKKDNFEAQCRALAKRR